MSSLLSSISIKAKLFFPAVSLFALFLIVLFLFFKNQDTIVTAEKSTSEASLLAKDIYSISKEIEVFSTSETGSKQLNDKITGITETIKKNSNVSFNAFINDLNSLKNHISNMSAVFKENSRLKEEIDAIADGSIKESNDFLNDISARLAGDTSRFSVTTFERKIIVPATENTNKNHQIKLIFQSLKQQPSAAEKLRNLLAQLKVENDEAIIQLEGSPGLAQAKRVRTAIKEIRGKSEKYIGNLSKIQSLNDELELIIESTLNELDDLSENEIQGAFSSISSSLTLIILVTLLFVIGTIIISLLIASSIIRPLNELKNHISDLAEKGGDLTFRINLNRHDEIGNLALGINNFIDSLQKIFTQVARNADDINESAQKAAATSKAGLAHIIKQQQETNSVAVAFDEIDESIKEIAQNASSASDKVQITDQRAREVVDSINTTLSNINLLGTELATANDVIQQLNQDSQDIGSILDVIRSIAEQTNLLALNAAIEAARAGDQGRGFAVVADEVRSLAQRTQSSIEEINNMISKLQKASVHATEVIGKGNEQIIITSKNSEAAGKGVEDISNLVSSMAHMNIQIASSVEEQSMVVQNINVSLQEITQLSNKSSESSKESNKSAEAQAASSKDLLSLIAKFKV